MEFFDILPFYYFFYATLLLEDQLSLEIMITLQIKTMCLQHSFNSKDRKSNFIAFKDVIFSLMDVFFSWLCQYGLLYSFLNHSIKNCHFIQIPVPNSTNQTFLKNDVEIFSSGLSAFHFFHFPDSSCFQLKNWSY